MIRLQQRGRPVFILMIALGLLVSLPHPSAFAALIPTGSTLDPQTGVDGREKVRQFLARADVRTALVAQGIDPAEAEARVAGLTDSEIDRISGGIDMLPAAGSVLETAIVVLLIVLLIVVILKLVGKL